MRRLQIPTSIRREHAAIAALALVTACFAAVLVTALLLGDTRRLEVTLTNPETGLTVASTVRAISVTFGTEPDRESVQEHLSLDPFVPGVVRWRGKVLEYVFSEPLDPGDHRLVVTRGAQGRAGERLKEDVVVEWRVREPSIVVVSPGEDGDRLLVVGKEGEPRELYKAFRVVDFAISADGTTIAVIGEDAPAQPNEYPPSRLVLVNPTTGEATSIVDSPSMLLGAVSWSADSQFLVAVRRERQATGQVGVPRAWILRLNGEFIQPVDVDGQPSVAASWSPDGQWIGYVAPATATIVAWNIASQETRVLGQPRSVTVAWSPDSATIAFESTPEGDQPPGTPAQPIAVRSLDLSIDRTLGQAGETRSYPRFVDGGDTVVSVRRVIGERLRTDLVFESVDSGAMTRAVLLSDDSALITGWDLDPSGRKVVFVRRFGNAATAIRLDLDTLEMSALPVSALFARWLP